MFCDFHENEDVNS